MPSGLANGVPGRQCWCFGRNKHFTSFGLNAESTYNWQASQWLVPVNVSVTQLLKFGKQPVSIQLGYRYYAEGSNSDPDWGLRFSVTYLFPK